MTSLTQGINFIRQAEVVARLAPLLPPDIARRILAPSYEVTLYQVR